MKKLILAVLGIAFLGVVGVSVYVSTIDWNKHKEKLTQQLLEITGKRVVFNGPVSLTLFPRPNLTAKNVRVYSAVNNDLEHPLMKIESLVADLSFSALMGGSFDVKMMSLVKPQIFLQRDDNGINWVDDAKTNSNAEIKNVNIALDSVLLNDATMTIIDEAHDVNVTLDNLKAEVVADSLNGPFRIDGSYVKGNNPEGFAISIGSLSDSFATNLNLVLNQPASETYLRFDGTFLLSNTAVNGNLIMESKKFKDFCDSMFAGQKLSSYWDEKFETSMELRMNKSQIELANIILKYGNTAGAGNVTIPLPEHNYNVDSENTDEKPQINVKFDMTDLSLEPFVLGLKDFAQKQQVSNAVYAPDYPFNIDVELSVLKAEYNGQIIKDLKTSFNLEDNVWNFMLEDGLFPGNSDIKASAKMFSVEDVLNYSARVNAKTDNLKKMLEWLNIPVKQVASSTYLKSTLEAEIEGDVNSIRIEPLVLKVDNTQLNGALGAKKGTVPHYDVALQAENINLDNYVPPLEKQEGEGLSEVLNGLWQKAQWTNNVDMNLQLSSGLIIFDSTPWEKVVFNAALQNGTLNVTQLAVANVLKSKFEASGEVKGLGDKPQLNNVNYAFETEDLQSWMTRFEVDTSKVNWAAFQPFVSNGVISVNGNRIWLKAENKNGDTESAYNGRITQAEGKYLLNGELQLRSPNVVALLKNLQSSYVPAEQNLGRLGLNTQIVGNTDKFKMSDMQLSVGANTFQGTLGADLARQVPYWVANLKINRFESERFMPKKNAAPRFGSDKGPQRDVALWRKPNLSDEPFAVAKLRDFTMVSKFEVNELLFKDKMLKNVTVGLENKNSELVIKDLKSDYNNGKLAANIKFGYAGKPRAVGDFSVTKQNVYDLGWSGDVYGVKSGEVDVSLAFDTSALSYRDVLDNFSGVATVEIRHPVISGWDFAAISDDLAKRKQSEGLQSVLLNDLQQGETAFDDFSGKIAFKDGDWRLEKADLTSNEGNVGLIGSGNLGAWTMDTVFKTQLSQPAKINPFNFSLKGAMFAPELSVNAELITKVYDDQKAKIEAIAKAKQEAYEQDLQNKMNVQKAVLQGVEDDFDKFVNDSFLKISDKLSNDKYKADMALLATEVELQQQDFAKADALFLEDKPKDEYPQMLADVSAAAAKKLEHLQEAVKQLYEGDLLSVIADNYANISETAAARNKLMADSVNERDNKLFALTKIDTDFRFELNKMYRQLSQTIDEQVKAFDEAVKGAERYAKVKPEENTIEDLEQYAADSSAMLAKAKNQQGIIADSVQRYLNYMDETIKVEEKAAADRQASEEEAKKIEENIGTIKAPATGKVQTIIRGIDEIEKDDNALPSTDSIGEVKADDLEINLLRNEAPVANVSGTISKK